MEIKIKIYRGSTKFELKNISEKSNFDFSEDINSGQGWFDIDLLVPFTNTDLQIWDLFEYSIYNEDYKNWLLKYTWRVNKIKRYYDKWLQWVSLVCESLTNLLINVEVNKTYSWTYQSIVNDIIADLPTNTCDMDFLWSTIFKNLIQNTSVAPDLVHKWNLLKALQDLFEDKKFFINQYGEIKDTFTKKHLFKFWIDIITNDTEEDETGFINSDIKIWANILDINVWDKIKIINTDTFLNLDNEQIEKLDFSLFEKNIFIWKIEQLVAS